MMKMKTLTYIQNSPKESGPQNDGLRNLVRRVLRTGYRLVAMLLITAACICPGQLSANNLVISGLSINQGARQVTFNITWDHSWRITATPANWDAAWVFVKFRDCSSDANTTQF